MTAIWKLYLDAFPAQIRLPRPPVASITSIEYLDTDGNLQTLATTVYQSDLISEPPRIMLAEGQNWPSTQSGTYNVVTVTYVAGYTDAASVPAAFKTAIKMWAGDLYEHREARLDLGGSLRVIEDNPTVMRLLNKRRVWDMP